MTKNDIVERLAEEHEHTKTFARDLVDSVFQMITTAAQSACPMHAVASISISRSGRTRPRTMSNVLGG